mgnify:FL=1
MPPLTNATAPTSPSGRNPRSLTGKDYTQILRLAQEVGRAFKIPDVHWTDLAHDCVLPILKQLRKFNPDTQEWVRWLSLVTVRAAINHAATYLSIVDVPKATWQRQGKLIWELHAQSI